MVLGVGGIGPGLGLALLGAPLLSSLLFRVSAVDPVTYGGSVALVLAVVLAACSWPAARDTGASIPWRCSRRSKRQWARWPAGLTPTPRPGLGPEGAGPIGSCAYRAGGAEVSMFSAMWARSRALCA